MAIEKELQETVLLIEVENGVDDSGNTVYKKKSFSRVKGEATDENIFNVATAITLVLKPEVTAFFLDQNYVLSNVEE